MNHILSKGGKMKFKAGDIVVFEDGEIGEVQAWYANGRWLIMRHSYFYGLAIFIIYESLFKRIGKL